MNTQLQHFFACLIMTAAAAFGIMLIGCSLSKTLDGETLSCTEDSDCDSGQVCTDGVCSIDQDDPECESDSDCGSGEFCAVDEACKSYVDEHDSDVECRRDLDCDIGDYLASCRV